MMKIKIRIIFLVLLTISIFSSTAYSEILSSKYEEIFQKHKIVRLIIDVETGDITTVNDEAVLFYGYTRDELLKMKITDINTLTPEETRKEWEAAAKEERNHFNFRHRLASGEIRDVEVFSYPLLYEGKNYLYSLVIDVTEVLIAEQRTNNRIIISWISFLILGIVVVWVLFARREAEKSNNAKGRFLANMSHEIRTPLNGISGIIDLLLHTNTTEEQKNYLEILKESSSVLTSIVDDVLDLSKIEAGKIVINRTKSDIRKIVYSTVEIMEIVASPKNIEFKINIDPEVPNILYVDSNRIKQIFLNLLGNSVKFTSEGEINITISKHIANGDYFLKFSVKDNGIGINQEHQKSIFNPFFHANDSIQNKYGGNGLGLAICKKLVNVMGGEIYLSSKKNVGTEVFFTLPSSAITYDSDYSENVSDLKNVDTGKSFKADSPILSDDDVKKPFSVNKKLKILIAEDNQINQIILCKYLEILNHTYATASNGEEAYTLFQNEHFDVIFMDLQMPLSDGYKTSKLIRKTTKGKNIPIVAITAYAMAEDREKCFNSGMNYFIPKPFVLSEIVSVLNKILYSSVLNEIIRIDSIDVDLAFINMRSDIVFFTDIVNKFNINSKELLTKINESISLKDSKELRINSHTLKGLVLIFEGRKAYELCRILEEFGKENNTENADIFITELIKEITHLTNVLNDFVLKTTNNPIKRCPYLSED